LIHTNRCLIPADGFYEWQRMGAVNQPFCFEVDNGEVFAFAGLWDELKNPTGEVIKSCTILTTVANSLVAEIHDRMPVVLAPDKYSVWLNEESPLETVLAMLQPYDAKAMRCYPVSTRLNNSQNEGPECATPIEIETPAQGSLL
jgi:putative SOS response-associated peptidase YedK